MSANSDGRPCPVGTGVGEEEEKRKGIFVNEIRNKLNVKKKNSSHRKLFLFRNDVVSISVTDMKTDRVIISGFIGLPKILFDSLFFVQ